MPDLLDSGVDLFIYLIEGNRFGRSTFELGLEVKPVGASKHFCR